MKVLQMALIFKLPNDFNGTFSDALRELAAFCEDKNIAHKEPVPYKPLSLAQITAKTELYNYWWSLVQQGIKLHGNISLAHLNNKFQWIKMPLGIVNPVKEKGTYNEQQTR